MLDSDNNIIISTWQSWSRWLKDGIAIEPDYVIVDEAHTLAKNKLPWDYMKAFANTKYRYGLTATENELIHERLTLEGLLGPVLYRELPEKLIEEGFLAKPVIRRLFIKHNIVSTDQTTKVSTRDLVRSPVRMTRVADFIDKHIPPNESLLVLTEAVEEEIKPFTDILVDELGPNTDIFQLTRVARRKEREAIINIVSAPERRTILVVTYGLFQMGIDIPSLKHIMLFSPSRSHIRVLQSIGRGLRPKDYCYVYDMIDYCVERRDTMASKRLAIYKGAYGDQLEIIDDYCEL
jgi:superfamily II DNA or RNA helicase